MTQDKTIELARQAGFRVGPSRDGPDDVWGVGANLKRFAKLVAEKEREQILFAIKELRGRSQEPVAWMNDSTPSGIFARHMEGAKNFGCTIPLYTTPPPCPTCEALARTVMLDQTSHDAQRKPLTDEEMKKIWYAMQNIMGWYSFEEVARAIEAAHGIKEMNNE